MSPGSEPSVVNPYTVQGMKEVEIDISSHCSKDVKDFRGMGLDPVIAVCDHGEQICLFFPAEER